MICAMCGQQYFRKPKDTNSKYCSQCRPAAHRLTSKRAVQFKRIRELAQIKFYAEWRAWQRDFALGKTQSNLEVLN